MTHRRFRWPTLPGALVALAPLALVALPACTHNAAEPQLTEERWRPPPEIRVDSAAADHRVVLVAPSGGWQLTMDQIRKRFGRFDVYVTLTRPDPTFAHTQAIVEQLAGTAVERTSPIRVYARTVDFKPPIATRSDTSRRLGPYTLVGDFPGVTGTTQDERK